MADISIRTAIIIIIIIIKQWLQLRFDFDSTAVRLLLDCNLTALRSFDDKRRATCVRAAALRPN